MSVSAPVYDILTVGQLLGFAFAADDFSAIGSPPKSLEGFITFFDPGWSIHRLLAMPSQRSTQVSSYDDQEFAVLAERPRYRQVRREPLHDSFGKTYAQQCSLVPEGEEIPLARVVVAMIVIHFLATQERLFRRCFVRTSDVRMHGDFVHVGHFEDNLGMDCWYPSISDVDVGVVSIRTVT